MGGATVSAETFFSVVMWDGKHEAVVGGNLWETFWPGIEFGFAGKADLCFDKKLVLLVPDEFGDCEDGVVNFELLLAGCFGGGWGFGSHVIDLDIFKFVILFSVYFVKYVSFQIPLNF